MFAEYIPEKPVGTRTSRPLGRRRWSDPSWDQYNPEPFVAVTNPASRGPPQVVHFASAMTVDPGGHASPNIFRLRGAADPHRRRPAARLAPVLPFEVNLPSYATSSAAQQSTGIVGSSRWRGGSVPSVGPPSTLPAPSGPSAPARRCRPSRSGPTGRLSKPGGFGPTREAGPLHSIPRASVVAVKWVDTLIGRHARGSIMVAQGGSGNMSPIRPHCGPKFLGEASVRRFQMTLPVGGASYGGPEVVARATCRKILGVR